MLHMSLVEIIYDTTIFINFTRYNMLYSLCMM